MRTLTRATTLLLLTLASALQAQAPTFTADRPSGIYRVGEEVGWTATGRPGRYGFTIRRDGGEVLSEGTLDLAAGGSGRIATTLDKQLRPIEAILRYQLFIHQLELEKINARGDAAAKIAEAIARAHERIVVIENR